MAASPLTTQLGKADQCHCKAQVILHLAVLTLSTLLLSVSVTSPGVSAQLTAAPPPPLPNQAGNNTTPPPSRCTDLLSGVLDRCGSALIGGTPDFSAPACCGQIFLANEEFCFSTVTGNDTTAGGCILSSSQIRQLSSFCSLSAGALNLPAGSECTPPPPPPRPTPAPPSYPPPPGSPSTGSPPRNTTQVRSESSPPELEPELSERTTSGGGPRPALFGQLIRSTNFASTVCTLLVSLAVAALAGL